MTSFDQPLWAGLVDFRSLNGYPTLPCPYCNQNNLKADLDSFSYREQPWCSDNPSVNRSMAAQRQTTKEIFKTNEFLGIIYGFGAALQMAQHTPAKFVGFFSCSSCGGDVAVTGTAMIPLKGAKFGLGVMVKAEYFSPPVPMFPIPATTPRVVAREVLQAFQHFHCDLTASGGKLRRAIEQLCEALGFSRRNLHESIRAMAQEFPKEAEWLTPLKLMGNEATHSDRIDEADLMASFRVLEAVLDLFRRKAMEAEIAKSLPILKEKFQRPSQTE